MSTRVLLVEGNDDEASHISRVLEAFPRASFVVSRVASLPIARQELDAHPYDAVVVDLDASASGAPLEGGPLLSRAPVVALVPEARKDVEARATELGAQVCFAKTEEVYRSLPFDLLYLCGRKEQARLASSAAVTAVGSLATDLAHEINNPLAVILANVEEAVRMTTSLEPFVAKSAKGELDELRTMLVEAQSASQRIQSVVRDLRVFACADERTGRVDVNAVIDASSSIAFAEVRHRARLVKDLNAKSHVTGSEVKLAQLFFNLLVNASHAVPHGNAEKNEIRIASSDSDSGSVIITVSDTGVGIPAADADRVFEPFFSTKPRRPGMGLAICQATVAAHGGTLSIHPREGGGTTVKIVLPAAPAAKRD